MRTASGPAGLGGDQVEGLHAVHELLASGKRRVRMLWVAQDLAGHEPLLGTVLLARRQQVPVQLKSPEALASAARTGAPQGVVAWAQPVQAFSLAELLAAAGDRPAGVPARAGRGDGPRELRLTAAHRRVCRSDRRSHRPPPVGSPDAGRPQIRRRGGRKGAYRGRGRDPCRPATAGQSRGLDGRPGPRRAHRPVANDRFSTRPWRWCSAPRAPGFHTWPVSAATCWRASPKAEPSSRSTWPRPGPWPASR